MAPLALLALIALAPTGTRSDDPVQIVPPLHGLAGAGWFYEQGCRLEEESIFDDSLRSFQAASRLIQDGRALPGVAARYASASGASDLSWQRVAEFPIPL